MRDRVRQIVLFLAIVGGAAGQSQAGFTVYSGADLGAGPTDPRPLSNAAAASFTTAAAALGSLSTITFENAPVGSFSSLAVAPGVTMTGVSQFGNNQAILNTPNDTAHPQNDGYNTTAGGSHYVEMTGGLLTFNFTTPIQSFGAYLTGVQSAFFADFITFNDGSTETITVPASGTTNTNGEVAFVGFTDASKSITSVTIDGGTGASGDFFGVDDVSFQSVPEPSSLVLCGIAGLIGLAVVRPRRKRAVTFSALRKGGNAKLR